MDRKQLLQQVNSYIELAKAGLELENQKFDFKSAWYNLKEIKGINEFLKDTSAIANTFGPDGFIVIGFDDKTKSLTNMPFSASGLNDTSALIDLINRRVDRLFYIDFFETIIDGHTIGIIHIPPSIDKPHVIRNYQTVDKEGKLKDEQQHRIFTRRGTQTFPASKYDIELMFYDRKNVIPEYKVQCSFHYKSLSLFFPYITAEIRAIMPLTMENIGSRPVSIIKFDLNLYALQEPTTEQIIKLTTGNKHLTGSFSIQPGRILTSEIVFSSLQFPDYNLTWAKSEVNEIVHRQDNILTKSITLSLSNGLTLESDLIIATN